MITTIFFDFVGVLMEVNASAVVSHQVEMVDHQIGEVIDDHRFRERILNDYCLSEMQFETILEQIVERYQPFDPLWRILPDLRKSYSVGIINNGTWLTYPRFNAKYGIEHRFDIFVSSALEGVRKPNHQIYLRACEKLYISPDQCLFLDDSKDNVSSAVKIGMQGIWWETHQTGFQEFIEWIAANRSNSPLKR